MSEDRRLDEQAQRDFEFTQSVRRGMINEMTKESTKQLDNSDRSILLQTMRDMDAQNIQRLRVQVEEKNGDNLTNMAGAVSQILREINPAAFAVAQNNTREIIDVHAKQLPDNVPKAQPVPGELAVDPPQGDYNSFISRMKS